jgi:coenzyme F420-dependent glucose-6-phosphate dehydrogenase
MQVGLNWASTEEDAALQWALWCGELELRAPQDFDMATRYVKPEDMKDLLLISSDLGQPLDWLSQPIELGFEELQLHQAGRSRDAFLEAFGPKARPHLRWAARLP